MTEYQKPSLSFADQLRQMQDRGLQVADEQRATTYLRRVGYYRLMGYLFPQRLPQSDHYAAGATFEEALELYELDCVLRERVIEATSHIEVAMRTSITYHFSRAHGPFGHHLAEHFTMRPERHREWLDKLNAEVSRSREEFLAHYRSKYTQPAFPQVPLWMASEVMSMGTLSKLYTAMWPQVQKAIARDFALPAPVLGSWLHAVSVLRNLAAHHGRLWNRELGVQPVRPRVNDDWSEARAPFPTTRVFYMILLLKNLLGHTPADIALWRDRVTALLQRMLTSERRLASMGATPGWQTHDLWQ